MGRNNTEFNLTIKMNGKEIKNTLNGVGKELRSMRSRTKNLTEGTEEYYKANKELAKTEKIYDDMKKNQRELLNETKKNIDAQEDHNSALNDFSQGFGQLFSSIKSGDFVGAREGFNGITSGIKGATKAGLAFIATPVGAAIAALTVLFIAGREVFNFNKGLEVMNQELRALGVSSTEIGKVRDEIKATAETFDKEFKEIAKNAKSVSESFGISMSEANDVIARGLADGGAKNDEFLQSLGEYDEFFSAAGYSAQEFVDVINQGYELGIYKDKLPDALKEADLSLREQSKSTRDAIVNAFGATFTDDILKRINTGETTTKEALQEIAAEAEKSGLSMQQQAKLTADVFRGAGEDAGGALKVLEAVGKAATRELDGVAQANLELQEANEKLNKAQSELFGIESFGEIWINIKRIAINSITAILDYFVFLKKGYTLIAQELLNVFVKAGNGSIDVIISLVEKARPLLRSLGVEVDALVKGLEAVKFEKFDFFGDDNDQKVPPPPEGPVVDEEAEKKRAEAAKERLAEEAAAIKKRDDLKAEIAKNEKKRIEEVDKLEAEYIKKKEDRLATSAVKEAQLEKDRAVKKAEDLKASQQLMDQIKAEHDVKIAEAKLVEEEEELLRLTEFETRKKELMDELELLEAETDEEKKIIQEEQRMEEDMRKLEQMKLTVDERNQLIELLQEKHQEKLQEIENKGLGKRIKDDEKFHQQRQNLINNTLGAAINAVGVETRLGKALLLVKQIQAAKEMGIELGLFKSKMSLNVSEATGDSAKGLAKTASALPFPANIPLIIGFAAQVAGIIGTIRSVTSAGSGVKTTGFAKGGFTDAFGMGQIDESGKEVAGVVHKNEYVVPEFVRQMPGIPPILDYLEDKRKQGLGGFAQGGETSSQEDTSTTSSDTGNSRITEVLERLIIKLDKPFIANLLFGYDAELKRQEVQKELLDIEQANQVKK
jgi:hypothetical protein